jgi:ABC-2 type transport system ATP-binding protein
MTDLLDVQPARQSPAPQSTALDPSELGEPLIVLSGLTKRYDPTPRWMRPFVRTHVQRSVQALDGVDLVVRAGEICAVVGPNGAGKTTLFRIIVGLTTPTSGAGTVLGLDVEHDSEPIRQVTGWMPSEDRSLLMRATCVENLYLHGRLQGMTPRQLKVRIPEMLDVVSLTQQRDAIVAGLSAGMRARLRLARALLPRPRVLLLDEPTGAIDPIAAHALLGLITELAREERLAILLSSHRLEEIEALQSYAVLLDGGRVRYAGDLDRLRQRFEEQDVEITFADADTAERAADEMIAAAFPAVVDGPIVRCRLTGRTEMGELLVTLRGNALLDVRRLREVPMPLRDLIAHVYSHEPTAGRRGP